MNNDLTEIKSKINIKSIVIAGIISVVISKLPFGSLILFPFSMFVTYIHEASHGLAAIFTGGQLVQFTMQWDTSGLAYTAGGLRFIIVSAGYLGSCFFSSLLLLASLKKSSEKPILIFFSLFFLLFTLIFARNAPSFLSGLFFSLAMVSVIQIRNKEILSLFLAFLSVQSFFNAFNDIWELLFLSRMGITTDAHIISQELTGGFIPPIFFAIIWGIIAISTFLVILKKATK